jgi:hypothetical protein
VISDQRVQPASGFASLRLEFHQQVQHLGGMIAAIDEVAVQHQVGGAAGPGALSVYQRSGPQQFHQALVVSMHVADGHNAADVFKRIGKRLRESRSRCQQRNQACGATRHG